MLHTEIPVCNPQMIPQIKLTAFDVLAVLGSPSHVLPESYVAVVKAFLAVYELLPKSEFRHQDYYLGNLGGREPGETGPITKEDVLKAAARCVHKVETATKKPYTPHHVGRNLYAVIDGERITDTSVLNEALAPFWPTLWRLAAKGHFRVCKEPLRAPRNAGEELYAEGLFCHRCRSQQPAVRFHSRSQLSTALTYSVLLVFPGSRGVMYPLSRYPMVAGFRSMLFGLCTDKVVEHFNSELFYAYTSRNGDEIDASFRAHDNGITFGFSPQDWAALKTLFTKAWNTPEVSRTWDRLVEEYGEL